MGVETTKMFTVKCNMCSKRIEPDNNGFNCYNDEVTAQDKAEEDGWIFYGNVSYCPKCQKKRDPNVTHMVRGNDNREYEVYKFLNVGQEVICTQDVQGIGGDFIPFPMTVLKKDEVYTVVENCSFNFKNVSYIVNEDGCRTWVTKEYFKLKK